ncbi:polyprenol monophosphomannose synthase [Lacunimicrobium album]
MQSSPTARDLNADRVLVILCTYNEAQNIRLMIEAIHEEVPHADILVVEDNSPDGTGRIVDELMLTLPFLKVMHRAGKLGLGTATRAGLWQAVEEDYTFAVVLDADFSHHPAYMSSLIDAMDRADVAVGSRYVEGGGVVGWSWKRHAMSRLINFWARLMLGLSTLDNSGSYRCYRVSLLRKIDFSRFKAKGYAIQEELMYRCRVAGARFVEVPIVFEDRVRGASKITSREGYTAVYLMLNFGLKRLFGIQP